MGEVKQPEHPKGAFRLVLEIKTPRKRLDQILMEELRKQSRSLALKNISRTEFKELFKKKRIRIKGQPATPSSSVAAGVTYIDILGFGE